jgi:hypothetical protein
MPVNRPKGLNGWPASRAGADAHCPVIADLLEVFLGHVAEGPRITTRRVA